MRTSVIAVLLSLSLLIAGQPAACEEETLDDAPMVIYNEHFADNVAHNPTASRALHDLCREAGMDVQLFLRAELDNLDDAPDPFDWMVSRLGAAASGAGRDE